MLVLIQEPLRALLQRNLCVAINEIPELSALGDLLDQLVLVCDHSTSRFDCVHCLIKDMTWSVVWVCDNDGLLRQLRRQDASNNCKCGEKGEFHREIGLASML